MTKKNIFLLDGGGAVISALTTGIVLPLFHSELGLPKSLFLNLAIYPIMCAAFSLSCYFLAKDIKPWMLQGIILANVAYCLIAGFLILGYEGITFLGKTVFAFEILVVLAVVSVEIRAFKKLGKLP